MENWCKIIEKNNKQYLFTHEYDTNDEVDKLTIKFDVSKEYPESEAGIIALSLSATQGYTFTEEKFNEFCSEKTIEFFTGKVKKIFESIKF